MHEEPQEWRPNKGPQTRALQSIAFETLYGGARGGGKTDAGIVWLLKEALNPRLRALVIRRNADDLSDWLDRSGRMYLRYGGKPSGQPHTIHFPSGAIIRTGHLKDDQAYTKYQGHEYQRILIEEVTQIPEEDRYLRLLGSCRSTIPGLEPRAFLTTNPGGPGHGWVKRRFVDPSPPGIKFNDPVTARTRVFIPARVEDTPQLVANDPGYIRFLEGLKETNVELWKAWRLGDWDTFAGQFFAEFRRDRHVIRSFTPRAGLAHLGGIDWGYTANFVFLSAVFHPSSYQGRRFNRLIVWQEICGTSQTPEEWAKKIQSSVALASFDAIRGDPSMFHKQDDGSISIADQFKEVWGEHGYRLKPANNDRLGGWAMLHKWFSLAPDGLPYLLITDNCTNLIRTIPELVHDEYRVEDLDSDADNDHWADALRYLLMHTQWIDASVGAVGGKPTLRVPIIPSYKPTLDLSKFETASVKNRDWKAV